MHRRPRALPVVLATVLAASVAGAIAPATARGSAGAEAVTVFLKAPDLAGLRRLAGAHDISRSARLSSLAKLVPSAATHAAVVRSLRATGFRITDETAWSVSAIGPQPTARALFGTDPTTQARTHAARERAATRALPRIPAALRSSVVAVFPSHAGTNVYHRATSTLAGPGFRNAYTPPTTTPSTGTHDGLATVATLQLANFHDPSPTAVPGDFSNSKKAADLTKYAQLHGIADPVANGHYKAVKVAGGPSAVDDRNGGDIEVNLDQQSILSTAPSAHQQAYFAPNDGTAHFNAVFAHVYDDVVGNKFATAKNPHIVALSSSWGMCESGTGYRAIKSLEPILAALTAAGVTVFSSSGDAGIYDCGSGNRTADVDYPASSPYVVSVGGTWLHATNNAPNTGRNWGESAWTCGGPEACQLDHGGSGGGESGSAYAPNKPSSFGGFPVPGYQRAAINNRPFHGTTKRLVPDISADASPRSGFVIYTSDKAQCRCLGGTAPIGGTSLASPMSAALLTNALAGQGRFRGVGDIHGALYSAYRNTQGLRVTDPHKAVRDITTGQNGANADRSTDPSVHAQPGYDTVTGVGAVYWPAVMRFVLNPNHPVLSGIGFREPNRYASNYRTITASWTASRGADPRLLGGTHVVIKRFGASRPAANYYVFPASNSRSVTGVPGATYQLTLQARDIGGHESDPATRRVTVPLDDTAFKYGSSWQPRLSRSDIGGSELSAAAANALATAGGLGSKYALRVRTGPGSGRLGVFRNGRRIKTIDLRSARPGYKTVTFFSGSRAMRSFNFRTLSSKRVSLDAVLITY